MKKSGSGADDSLGPPLDEPAPWAQGGPDQGCDCPGPPPRFHLPPPPRPYVLTDSECSENSTSVSNTCEAVPVIDAEYHYSPAVPSLAIILTVAAAVVVFLFFGTFLVLLKKRKMQNLFPRKCSPQTRCDATSANGVIYEDLPNVRARVLSSHCLPGQTMLPSIEMLNGVSYPEHAAFGPALMCPTPPRTDSFDTRELFNPVYEELSNGSGEGVETDSEGVGQGAASEDEFAEDELSFGGARQGGLQGHRRGGRNPPEGFPLADDATGDVDSSDSDDKCTFLETSAVDLSLSSDRTDRRQRTCRGSYFGSADKRPKVLDRRKVRRSKAHPPLPSPPVACNEFHENFLLKRILQIYPDVTGMELQCSCERPSVARSENAAAQLRRPQPEIFSTFGPVRSCQKNQSQDSSLGSDSGYSNNTSGGKSSSRTRKEYALTKYGENTVLS